MEKAIGTCCTKFDLVRVIWPIVHAIACCEAGGFIYASALASLVDVPLVLIRKAGKLPPPVISVAKPRSHISTQSPGTSKEERIEIEEHTFTDSVPVVVIDDVLASGATLCAIVELLLRVGINMDDIDIIVVAEFPSHHGRELLRQHGFGKLNVRSLLVFDGH